MLGIVPLMRAILGNPKRRDQVSIYVYSYVFMYVYMYVCMYVSRTVWRTYYKSAKLVKLFITILIRTRYYEIN